MSLQVSNKHLSLIRCLTVYVGRSVIKGWNCYALIKIEKNLASKKN